MDSTSVQLFKVKTTQLEMMQIRGFNIPESEQWIPTSTVSDFIDRYKAMPGTFRSNLSQEYTSDDGRSVKVYYLESPEDRKRIGKEYVVGVVEELTSICDDKRQEDNKTNVINCLAHAIVITETELTDDARKALESIASAMITIERFVYNELSFTNIRHALQPNSFRLMSEEESKDFLIRNKLNMKELPKYMMNEAVPKFFGAKPGRIFEIVRNNLHINSAIPDSLYYRVVVPKTLSSKK